MNNEIDRLYKKLDEQRVWYLDQIADIKEELDRVNKAWIKEHKKVSNAIEYILGFDYYIPEDNKDELLNILYGIDINKSLSENIDNILRGEE